MLRVMSCNIRFANPFDEENDWRFRKDLVARLILDSEGSIVGTQEGREAQLRELADLLPNYQLLDFHREWIAERMYPSLFIRKSLFEVKVSGDIWLSKNPYVPGSNSFDSAFPRLCTYALLKDKNANKPFVVVNCHLDHVKEETRVSQIKVLLKEIADIFDKGPLILLGDFNSSPKGMVRKVINEKKSNLVDPWITLDKEEETSFHRFDGIDQDGGRSRIDWILHDQSFEAESIRLVKDHENGRYPSDHFFVTTDLTWR